MSDSRGFTFVEVVVATAVLACICLAVTVGLMLTLSLRVMGERETTTQGRARALIESLRWAPLCENREGGESAGVADRFFPHAVESRNTGDAFFAPDSREGHAPATFFTALSDGSGAVRVAATFVRSTRDGWQPLTTDALSGYDGSRADPLPAASLLVVAEASWCDGDRQHVLLSATFASPPLAGTGDANGDGP